MGSACVDGIVALAIERSNHAHSQAPEVRISATIEIPEVVDAAAECVLAGLGRGAAARVAWLAVPGNFPPICRKPAEHADAIMV